jgi:pectate lyase
VAARAVPRQAGAAETSPIGFGAGPAGGGSASAVTVSSPDAFRSAVTANSAPVVKVGGLISPSGRGDVGYVVGAEIAVRSHMGARMHIENAENLEHAEHVVFRSTLVAVTTDRGSDVDGYVTPRANDLGGAATEVSRVGAFPTPPYSYYAEPASSAVASVTNGAGTGTL